MNDAVKNEICIPCSNPGSVLEKMLILGISSEESCMINIVGSAWGGRGRGGGGPGSCPQGPTAFPVFFIGLST